MSKSTCRAHNTPSQTRLASAALLLIATLASPFLIGCDQSTISQGGGGFQNPPPTKPTSVTVTASPSPAHDGTVTIMATVTPSAAQGSATFYDQLGESQASGPTIGGLVPVVNGVGTLQASVGTTPIPTQQVLGIGTHTITAQTSFLAPYASSTSAPLTLLVANPNAVCGLGTAVAAFTQGSDSPPFGSSYTTTQENQNAVCVTGTSIALENATLIGSRGLTSYGDPAGVGSVLLAYNYPSVSQNSSITMTGGSIAANGGGQTAVVASGPGAQVAISGTTISAIEESEPIANSPYYGTVIAAYNGGNVMLTDTKVPGNSYGASLLRIADDSSIAVIRGTMNIEEGIFADLRGRASLSCTNAALTGDSVIQITHGITSTQPANLSISGGSMSYIVSEVSPTISISDTSADITLTNVALQPQTSSGTVNYPIFLEVSGDQDAAFDPLLNMTLIDQQLSGDLEVSSTSTMNLSLTLGSQWSGAFLSVGTIPGTITLTLDSNSTWSVTRDSAITTLNDPGGLSTTEVANILGNGHTVTYVTADNPSLGGKTYALANGGSLRPAS